MGAGPNSVFVAPGPPRHLVGFVIPGLSPEFMAPGWIVDPGIKSRDDAYVVASQPYFVT